MSKNNPSTQPVRDDSQRLAVHKTYKMYINGGFPRSESGRTDSLLDAAGTLLANVCRGSRKDFREAAAAARKAQASWAQRSAYNRSQILYRVAEMLEGRRAQFHSELAAQGCSPKDATVEIDTSIDRLVYYAGWADKIQQVFGSVNPVESSHFNFSMLEPTGVAAAICPQRPGLLGLVSVIAPIIVSGNTVVALASEEQPLTAVTFGEVLNSSDVPAGVVNLLTGRRTELAEHLASHMDINALILSELDVETLTQLETLAADNVKRTVRREPADWHSAECESPYWILDTQEVKTTWHPVGT